MKTVRKLHLWMGVIVAVFLLSQSVTGLILANAHGAGQGPPRAGLDAGLVSDEDAQLGPPRWGSQGFQGRGEGFGGTYAGARDLGTLGVIKALHEGRIDNYDFSLLLDVVTIGFILLTITGLILAYKVLKRPKEKAQLKEGNTCSEIPKVSTEEMQIPESSEDTLSSKVDGDSSSHAKEE